MQCLCLFLKNAAYTSCDVYVVSSTASSSDYTAILCILDGAAGLLIILSYTVLTSSIHHKARLVMPPLDRIILMHSSTT